MSFDEAIKFATPLIVVGLLTWAYKDSRLLEVVVKLTPLIGVTVAFLAFTQAGKIFAFENRAIPTVRFEPNNAFKIVIKNAGKSPITQMKGYYAFFYGADNKDEPIKNGPFYLPILETDEPKSYSTDLTSAHLKLAEGRILFLAVGLNSKDLKFYADKTYIKIFYANLSTDSAFNPEAWKETDESLFSIGPNDRLFISNALSKIKKTFKSPLLFPKK